MHPHPGLLLLHPQQRATPPRVKRLARRGVAAAQRHALPAAPRGHCGAQYLFPSVPFTIVLNRHAHDPNDAVRSAFPVRVQMLYASPASSAPGASGVQVGLRDRAGRSKFSPGTPRWPPPPGDESRRLGPFRVLPGRRTRLAPGPDRPAPLAFLSESSVRRGDGPRLDLRPNRVRLHQEGRAKSGRAERRETRGEKRGEGRSQLTEPSPAQTSPAQPNPAQPCPALPSPCDSELSRQAGPS